MAGTADKFLYLYPMSVPLVDWIVFNDGDLETITFWNAALGPQPTQEELAAISDEQVTTAAATRVAQTEKTEATKGVDDAFQQHGNRVERIVMSVATSAIKVINVDRLLMNNMNTAVQAATSLADLKTRWAALSWPQPITNQQLINSVKADIAATPE